MQVIYALTLRKGKWRIRIDGPHSPNGQRHVHITANRLSGEYSWNVDGTRHDEHRFPTNDKEIEAATRLAAQHLGISRTQLSFLTILPAFEHVEISLEHSPTEKPRAGGMILVLPPAVKAQIVLLRGRAGRVHVVLIESEGNEDDLNPS